MAHGTSEPLKLTTGERVVILEAARRWVAVPEDDDLYDAVEVILAGRVAPAPPSDEAVARALLAARYPHGVVGNSAWAQALEDVLAVRAAERAAEDVLVVGNSAWAQALVERGRS